MAVLQKQYLLGGLGCAVCAGKIEEGVSHIEGVAAAQVDFATELLTVTMKDGADIPSVEEEARRIAHSIESQIVFSRRDESMKPAVKKEFPITTIFLIIAGVLFGAALLVPEGPLSVSLFVISYVLAGGEVVWRALRNLVRGNVFDENFLMTLATAGAFAIGEVPEAAAVMLFYGVGEWFQNRAVRRSRASIASLMDIRPDTANLIKEGELIRVSPEEVPVGAFIAVRPGEKIPLDGVVTEGTSSLDTTALTGESVPRDISPGESVLSGCVNLSGTLTIEVTKSFGESTVSKILELVQNASTKKAETEQFITRFARYYTPVVVILAAALAFLPPILIPGAAFGDWLNRALVFLVVSCPCALVISIPLSFFGGIGGASRNGILVKGGNTLEALARLNTVVFDKTGTLTKGSFEVIGIYPEAGFTDKELLRLAAAAESESTHPIARSVLSAYEGTVDRSLLSETTEMAGRGIKARYDGITVMAGNAALMETEGIAFRKPDEAGTVVYVAAGLKFAGSLVIADRIREDSAAVVKELRELGISRIAMLTGDNDQSARRAAEAIGIDEVHASLLPEDKVSVLEEIAKDKKPGTTLGFAGDGINDAPVLAGADVGIAMGAIGSDAAIEAADVVLMTDEPGKIAKAVRIARKTRRIVWQNVAFALAVKGIILLLGALGVATMWEAVFGDVGVALLAVLNAMRVMKS